MIPGLTALFPVSAWLNFLTYPGLYTVRPSGSHLEGYVPDFCRGWGILRLSLPEAEIFIMINLDLQVFTREGVDGNKEQEPNQGWAELPTDARGFYSNNQLWKPTQRQHFAEYPPKEGLFEKQVFIAGGHIDLPSYANEGLAIVSHGKAEVWAGNQPLIKSEKAFITKGKVVLVPASAVNPGGRTEIFFDRPNQFVDLTITIDGQPVKEVRIKSVTSQE